MDAFSVGDPDSAVATEADPLAALPSVAAVEATPMTKRESEIATRLPNTEGTRQALTKWVDNQMPPRPRKKIRKTTPKPKRLL
jgi:hypothetical protein